FGGAVTLLPIFADEYLHVGAAGLGLLRAAPSVGAAGMALILAHLPLLRRAGKSLLWAVAGFGIATIIFGISRSFLLSLAMLAVLGALDNISVVIRSTLLLVHVPDDLRGRISAVNNVFVGASNELGGFESGLTAALFGPILSVIGGGVGTILVVIVVALIWPEMRRLREITSVDIH
ncbi:MAG: MFS transporter, partial [Ktedonobacterales bacterium]